MWWWPIYGLAAAVGCMAVLVLDDAGCQWREQRRGTGGAGGEDRRMYTLCLCRKAKQAPATSANAPRAAERRVRLVIIGATVVLPYGTGDSTAARSWWDRVQCSVGCHGPGGPRPAVRGSARVP